MPMYTFYKIFGVRALFDLSNGSLSGDQIGTYDGVVPIYSAEALLNEIEGNGTTTIYKKELPEEKIYWRDAQ